MLRAAWNIVEFKKHNKNEAIQLLYARITLRVILRGADNLASGVGFANELEVSAASMGTGVNASYLAR